MSRYIDADVLKQKWLFRGKDGKPYCDEIDAMPTANVREVAGEPIPHWRGQMDGCLPFQKEEHDEV